jgi:Ca2+-transporting ATPase
MPADKVLEILKSSKDWLNSNEIEIRIGTYGKNVLTVKSKVPQWLKFLWQFKDALIILLIVSAWICMYLQDYRWATILSIIVILNAIIWYIQEAKAEKIMQSLKKMIYPTARVKRDGKLMEIKSEDLVPWDVVFLEEGNNVPADIRIFEESELLANDFSLTGESNPINKFTHAIPGNVPLGERNNCLWMGTTVAVGNVWWVVIATWMETELGKIAHLSQETKLEDTPLQKEMTNIARKLSIWTVILWWILLAIALIANFSLTEAFIFAIWIAASMVPQWLPAQVNMALSLAAWRLAKNKALVKQLSSVETLGCVNVICTDKTWTLTKNEMTVKNIWLWNRLYEVSGDGYEPIWSINESEWNPVSNFEFVEKWRPFFNTLFMASNARVNAPDSEHPLRYAMWDPTEAALVSLAEKVWIDINKLDNDTKELHQYWFDSVRKMMSSVRVVDNEITVYMKWSPRSVLSHCSEIFDWEKVRKLTEKNKEEILKNIDELASRARRNLAIAYRKMETYSHDDMTMEDVEDDMIFVWFVSIIDPPREEVYAAIQTAYDSKIKVIMITGDHWLTAEAIAKEIW